MNFRWLLAFAFTVVTTAALLTACAQPKPALWAKDGATQEQFYQDSGQCKAQGFSVPGVTLVQAALVFNSCMQGKGYHQVQ